MLSKPPVWSRLAPPSAPGCAAGRTSTRGRGKHARGAHWGPCSKPLQNNKHPPLPPLPHRTPAKSYWRGGNKTPRRVAGTRNPRWPQCLSAAPAASRVRAGDSTGARPAARRAGHAAAAAADTARGRRPHALRRRRGGGSVARTLPLAVPPLTPIRKGSPPLGCWWFCRVCSLSPAMARAALPSRPVRADARALAADPHPTLSAPPPPPPGRPPPAAGSRCAPRSWRSECASARRGGPLTSPAAGSVMLLLQSGGRRAAIRPGWAAVVWPGPRLRPLPCPRALEGCEPACPRG